MAGMAYQTSVGLDPRFLSAPVVCLIALGSAFSALLLCWKPIVVPVVIEVVIATLFLFKPAAALKLTLFSAGLPLSLFYEEVGYSGGSVKPLFSEWGGTTPDGLRLILSSLFLAVVLCKLAHTRGLLVRFWPYVALLLFLACTLSYSTAPVDGMRLLLKMAFPFLSFLALAQLLKSTQDADAYSRYWIAGGVLASFCAPVLILFTGSRFLYPAGSFRYSPGFTSASSYSFYMLALFLFCYSQWRKRHSTGFALLSGLFGIQTIIPITRIAWVALLLGVAGFEWLHVKGAKKWAAAAAAVVVPVLVFYFLISRFPALQERVFQSKQMDSDFSLVELVQNVGLTGRGAVWLAALEDYQQHSRLLGQGIGSSDNYIMGLSGTVAHNEYLRILYDGGALGLSLFLLANLYLLYRLGKLRGSADAAVREYSAVGIALMLAYFVVALTDNPLDYYLLFTQYVFLVLGICVALSRYPSPSAHAPAPT
jgi:O-Antigen ligase